MNDIVRSLYNLVRPHTPRKIAVFNGVPVRDVRLFDATDVFPDYEEALVSAVRSQVSRGDAVVIVGGGRGVSTVAAANGVGDRGSVVAYEGSPDRVTVARETVEMSGVTDRAEVDHAVVGPAVDLASNPGGARSVAPEDLPECDLLVLDCEGAEIDILESLPYRPDRIVVETHEFLDSPESEVREVLADRDYEVVDRGVEVEEMGVYVLTAVDERSSTEQ